MLMREIRVGGIYHARISGNFVHVRVDAILKDRGSKGNQTWYEVTNLTTKRRTVFRSAAKFRGEVRPPAEPRRIAVSMMRCLSCGAIVEAGGVIPRPDERCSHEFEAVVEGRQEGEQRSDPTPTKSVDSAASISTSASAGTSCSTSPSDVPATSPLAGQLASAMRAESVPQPPHVIVEARAGTGKTTTLVEGLKILRGIGSRLTPSPQQRAVWDAIAQSPRDSSVCFVAFNKSIATELQARVPAGCDAMTMHSMGFRGVTKALGRMEPTQWATLDIIADLIGGNYRDLNRDPKWTAVIAATDSLVSLCKQNLTPINGTEADAVELDRLARHYEIELNGARSKVYELVPRVLERCKSPKGKISFDDMIWLPVVLQLPLQRYDLLLVDEAQDLNRCQQALAKMAGRRLILCGDPKQAIYGFAGADAESMARMASELSCSLCTSCGKTYGCRCDFPVLEALGGSGCVVLPLTVTRRCGRAIVAEANRIVPDFSAHESNPEGRIGTAAYPTRRGSNGEDRVMRSGEVDYSTLCGDGDMVLCRVNAPLVSQCFRFLRAGRKANIQGRDVGAGLIATVKKVLGIKPKDTNDTRLQTRCPELIAKLSDWLAEEMRKEQSKSNPSEQRLIAMQDRFDCLVCFTDGVETVAGVITKIESVFTDDKESKGIRLSSIHKAKGLEARRVFLLEPEGATVPHPMAKSAWQREQEMNLRYVAITRAIEELVFVS